MPINGSECIGKLVSSTSSPTDGAVVAGESARRWRCGCWGERQEVVLWLLGRAPGGGAVVAGESARRWRCCQPVPFDHGVSRDLSDSVIGLACCP